MQERGEEEDVTWREHFDGRIRIGSVVIGSYYIN